MSDATTTAAGSKTRQRRVSAFARSAVLSLVLCAGLVSAAEAVSIELKDVAPDRIERQRTTADGRNTLPGTPDLSRLSERLAAAGLKSGNAVLLRIFKETSELELWMARDGTYQLFATYPICHWSGTLGPKMREGDKQTPEGFYTITRSQIRHLGRWRGAINVGFPNVYDAAHRRDGSYILMHGGCSSVGCFAMTNPVIAEVYGLVQAAIGNGQRYVPLHIYPFRMTEEKLAANAASPWHPFWMSLKRGSDAFERTRRAPRISVCKGEYLVDEVAPTPAALPSEPVKAGRKSRAANLSILDSIRTRCPDPVVAAADGGKQPAAKEPDQKLVGAR